MNNKYAEREKCTKAITIRSVHSDLYFIIATAQRGKNATGPDRSLRFPVVYPQAFILHPGFIYYWLIKLSKTWLKAETLLG
jgi:hypothetical protein